MAAASLLGQCLKLLGHEIMFTPAAGLPKNEVIRAGERARYANHNGGALFVSIHCNASDSHVGAGTEVWYYSQKLFASDLAFAISLDKSRNRGAKQSDKLSVLTQTVMPAVLVELAFIDNDKDCKWLIEHWPAQVAVMAVKIHEWMEARI